MLVEKVLGKINNISHESVEYVSIEWHECHKRIIKKTLKNGEILGIRLSTEDAKAGLADGDVLAVSEGRAYVVEVAPAEALVIDATPDMVAKVCYEIGNRHAPFYKGENSTQFYTPCEMPVKVMLEKLGVKVSVGMVKLTQENAISSASGGHSHSHDDGGYDGKGGKVEGSFYKDDHSYKIAHSHSHSHDHGESGGHSHEHTHDCELSHSHSHGDHSHDHNHGHSH